MAESLAGKRILVTGGTTGIGEATVRQAAADGASVAFCGLDDHGAGELIAAIEDGGGCAYFEALDLSHLESARAFARRAIAALDGLDGLVNNAGNNFWHSVNGATYESIQNCFHLNFYAPWAISQEAHPALKAAGGGMVVNMASIHAQRTAATIFPYNVSKAMMVAMTQSMAIEWGPDNIQAVAIAPALIKTPLADAYLAQFDDPNAELARMETHYPIGRSGTADDVASLIVYLLSGRNRFISGTTVLVDGGISALMETPES